MARPGRSGAPGGPTRRYDRSGDALSRCLSRLPSERGLREGQVSAQEHTAAAYRSVKDYEKATQYYQQALKAAKDIKLREYEWLVLSDLGSMYGEMGNTKGAVYGLPTNNSPLSDNWATRKAKSKSATALALYDKPSGSKDSKPPRKR